MKILGKSVYRRVLKTAHAFRIDSRAIHRLSNNGTIEGIRTGYYRERKNTEMDSKVTYWLDLADEDLSVVKLLMSGEKYLQAGFFCHLIAEKSLKAIIASVTLEVPPRIHDLAKLAARARIFDELTENQQNLLIELNPLNIDGRYPEYKARISQVLTSEKTEKLLKETEDFLCWTKKKLGR